MTIDHALAILFLCGHALMILFVLNVSHGFGINAPWIDRAVVAALAVAGLAGLGMMTTVWGQPWPSWPIVIRVYSIACLGIALVGFPFVTIARHWRRPVAGTSQVASTLCDFRDERPAEAAEFVLEASGWRSKLFRIPMNESLRLSVVDWDVCLPGWPEALDGLSILHLTDLHFARTYPRAYFEWAIARASDGPPLDLVAITGDFLDDDACAAWIAPILGPLSARLGRFAILGNHDYRNDFRSVRRGLRDAGFRVLEGKWQTIPIGPLQLAIGGTSFPWGKDLGSRPVPAAEARIVLSHTPDQIYRASEWGVDLVLAGHVHGGQARLPIIGPVLMPSMYSRRFDRGFFQVGSTRMFVGQGLGAKDPLRVGCVPEIARLTIRAPKVAAPSRREVIERSDLAEV